MKRIIAVLLAVCLLAGAMPFTAGAAQTDVSTMDGFLKKLLIDGNFYDYDSDTITKTKTTSSFSYEDAMWKVFGFPSCIDADYSMSKNVYNLKFGIEKSYRTLPLADAKWLYTTIFNWSESTWANMLAYANSRGGYIDKSKKNIYIRNNKIYCSGADRGDWPNRLNTVSKRQDGSKVEVVLDWYTSDDYYGTANKLARRVYALVEQKTVSGKKYWTVHRTKVLGNTVNPLAVAGFDDVTGSDYFADPVKWAVENDITAGVSANKFGSAETCKREQIVTFLWKFQGKSEPQTTATFADMPSNETFRKAISWAAENCITTGIGNNKFGASEGCTRDQAMTFIWRAAGKPEPTSIASFTDLPDSPDMRKAISWAAENKITSGIGGGKFGSNQVCKRQEIVTFLYKAKDL